MEQKEKARSIPCYLCIVVVVEVVGKAENEMFNTIGLSERASKGGETSKGRIRESLRG